MPKNFKKKIRTFGTHLDRHHISYSALLNVQTSAPLASTPTSSASTFSSSTLLPAYTLPSDYLKSIVFKAPIEMFLFKQLDITQQFYLFQQKSKRLAIQSPLIIEDCAQPILALSSIFLIKPGRIHSDIYEFIDRATCSRFHTSIPQEHGIGQHTFLQAIKAKLEEIISAIMTIVYETKI